MRIFYPYGVLFLHAFPLNKKMYENQFRFLESKNIPYFAVDYFGFGDEKGVNLNYTISDLADSIMYRLISLGVKKVIPVGDSMGGYVMFEIWRRYRDYVGGFIFVSTRAEADTEEMKKGRYATIERIEKEGKGFLIKFMLDAQTSPTTKEDKEKMNKLECIMNDSTEEGIINALKALAGRKDSTGILKDINVPTLVVAGEDDEKVTPPSVVKKISDGISGSKFVVIPKSAHLPPFENPEEFNNVLYNFLREVL